jgi:hypothetical protein
MLPSKNIILLLYSKIKKFKFYFLFKRRKKAKRRGISTSPSVKTAVISLSDNSDSGYFRNGTKKAEGDVSVDGSFTGDEFKKLNVECGFGIGGFDSELGESSNGFKYVISGLGKELISESEIEQEQEEGTMCLMMQVWVLIAGLPNPNFLTSFTNPFLQ